MTDVATAEKPAKAPKKTAAAVVAPGPSVPAVNPNLALWATLESTDEKYAKSFNRSGFKGTAINPTWIMKRLTEQFGPVGIGWRFVLENEQYVPGHTMDNGDRSVIHVVRGCLEYRPTHGSELDKRIADEAAPEYPWCSTGPQFGQTTFVGSNKNGPFTDEEAPKKSITDCLSKCAVQLGVSADIHLGLWDDNKYVNDASGAPAGAAPRKPRTPARPTGDPVQQNPNVDLTNIDRAITTTTSAAELLVVIQDLHRSAPIYGDLGVWETVCQRIANQLKAIAPASANTPEFATIVAGLQAERIRIDAGKAGAGAK